MKREKGRKKFWSYIIISNIILKRNRGNVKKSIVEKDIMNANISGQRKWRFSYMQFTSHRLVYFLHSIQSHAFEVALFCTASAL